jgi:RecA/RadA recombinase
MAAKKKEEHTDSKSLLKNILQQNKDSHYNYVQPKQVVIPSGSLALDSLVKIRTGSFVRMCGKGSELGKTSECLVLAENFMKTMPKSKTIFVKAEARLSPEMQERSGLKYVIDSDEWDYGTVFVFGTNEFELIASTLETMIPSMHEDGEHLCVILDSLDGVILRKRFVGWRRECKSCWSSSFN